MSGVNPTNLLASFERKRSFNQKGINNFGSIGYHGGTLETLKEDEEIENFIMSNHIIGGPRAPPSRNGSFSIGKHSMMNKKPKNATVSPMPSNEFFSKRIEEVDEEELEQEELGTEKVNETSAGGKPKIDTSQADGDLTPVQRRWKKVKVASKAIMRLKSIEEDLRVFGAHHKDEEEEDEMDPRYFIQDVASLRKWWILLPSNKLRRAWEMLVIVLLLYILVVVPVRVCFDIESDPGTVAFDWFVDIVFILDVLVNCICAYTTPAGELIVDQKQILTHYAKTWLLLDIIASIPFYQMMDVENSENVQINRLSKVARLPKLVRLIRLLRLLKLLRVFKLVRYFNQWEHTIGINSAVTRMVKVTFAVFMATHLIGCFFYLVAWVGYDGIHPESWVYEAKIQDSDDVTKYLAAVYWSFSTLTTVGFGDIAARTNQERLFSILCMIVGVSWYSFVISTISSIISMFDRKNAEHKRKQRLMAQFMREARLSWSLRKRIMQYFEYLQGLEAVETDTREMESVLSMLSTQLRTEVTLHIHRNLIPQIPFFNNKTPQFIAACVSLLRPLQFSNGDYISTRGQHADEMYFLIAGRAVVVLPDGRRFKSIVEGSYFGEIACILSEIHRVSIVATTECRVYALSKADLKNLMNDYPDVAGEIRQTAKKRIEHLNQKNKAGDKTDRSAQNFETSFPGVHLDQEEQVETEYFTKNSTLDANGRQMTTDSLLSEPVSNSTFDILDGSSSTAGGSERIAQLEKTVEKLYGETADLKRSVNSIKNSLNDLTDLLREKLPQQ